MNLINVLENIRKTPLIFSDGFEPKVINLFGVSSIEFAFHQTLKEELEDVRKIDR